MVVTSTVSGCAQVTYHYGIMYPCYPILTSMRNWMGKALILYSFELGYVTQELSIYNITLAACLTLVCISYPFSHDIVYGWVEA